MGAEDGIDRRAFLAAAGVSAVALTAEAGCAADAVKTATAAAAVTVRRTRAARVPRTLAQAMRGHVFTRGSPGFSAVSKVYNERFDGVVPQAVARPINAADVAAAVQWCVAKGVPLRARSGGHSYAGYSTLPGGVVLDLSNMRSISVNRRARTATVGAGAQLIDVYAGLAAQGATIPAGSCPSVGVSGVTLGGGMGLAARAFGMTLDNVVGLKVVTADGRIRTVNKQSNPDLFWALRGGGGGNFGVVTQFTFNVHPLPSSAAYFNVTWPWSSASDAIEAWQAWAPHTTGKITSIFHINAGGGNSVTANGQYLGPASALRGLLGPLLSVPGASLASAFDSGYLALQKLLAGCSTISLHRLPHRRHTAGRDTAARELPGEVGLHLKAAAGGGPLGPDQCGRGAQRAARLRCVPVRRLRRRDQPGFADRNRVRPSQRAVLHPVPELQRRGFVAGERPRGDAPLRLGPGLPELHRRRAQRLAAGLLRAQLRSAEIDPPQHRPAPLLQLPAGDRALAPPA